MIKSCFDCIRCHTETKIYPIPIANEKATSIALSIITEPRVDSPVSNQLLQVKQIELKELNNFKLFSIDIISIRTSLKEDDF
jgi:hypothetical protein